MPDDAPTDHIAPDVLPLGNGPRPTDGPELAALVRAALLHHLLDGAAQGAERALVRATLDGADIPTLDVDLTGVVMRIEPTRPDRVGATGRRPWSSGEVGSATARRTDAVLRRARVEAHPLTYEDVPVDVVLESEGVAFRWVEGLDDSLRAELVEPADGDPLRGSIRVSAPLDALLATARRLVQEPLQESAGLTLTSFDVDVESTGPRSASAVGFARVRKGILSASIRARASIDVDARMVLTVRELDVSSRNPVVAAVLLAARKHVDELRGRSTDLAAELPPGLRLADVRLDVDDSVAVWARFA